jgi:non-heme chloroperoxidase
VSTTTRDRATIERPGFISTGDVELFHRDWPGSGDPVLFTGSWSLPSDSWNYQMLALNEQGHRVVAYDRRGHGQSSDPGHGYDFDTLADDLAAVIEALDLRNVTLVGHSMGPAEIIRYITRHGDERVARIVMIGTTTPLLHRAEGNPNGIDPDYFESFRRENLMKDLPLWIEGALEPFSLGGTSKQLDDWIRGMVLQASFKALIECHRSICTEDQRDELPHVTVPTLVCHGDRDSTSPIDETGRRTVELMPNATLKLYEGGPHALFLSHTERFNADLLEFIRS